jgi:hypothetical protein
VTAQIFGGRMNDNVRSVFDWPLQSGSGKSPRRSARPRCGQAKWLRQCRRLEDSDYLASQKKESRLLLDGVRHSLQPREVGYGDLDTESRQTFREERETIAIEYAVDNNVTAGSQ